MTEHERVFLLQGPEEGEKSIYINKLIEKITTANNEPPEVFRHYSFESNLLDIVSILCNGSLFTKHTVVILNNAEDIKKTDDLGLLVEYIASPSDNATLILTTPTVKQVSKKIMDKIPAKNTVIFWEMFENQRKGWITNFFRNNDIRIGSDALNFFLEMVSNNTRDVKQECNKLVLLLGAGSTITIEDLEKFLYHSKEENVFTLFEQVACRDFGAALLVLEKLFQAGESDSVVILSGLLFQAKKLLQIKLYSEKNYHIDEIFTKLGIISKKNQKMYLDAHKNYPMDEVKSMIVLFTDFDIRLRSYRSDLHELLLQMFLYYVIAKDSRIPELVRLFRQ
jgi:DNA polymerase III subunit delta